MYIWKVTIIFFIIYSNLLLSNLQKCQIFLTYPVYICMHVCMFTCVCECVHTYIYIYIYIYICTQGLNKFPDFFHMGTFIDSTHKETLVPFEVISSVCNALVVPFQQLLEGPIDVLLCERVNDLCHSLFHLLNCLITTASELRD